MTRVRGNTRARWTDADNDRLHALYHHGYSDEKIGQLMVRTTAAVTIARHKHGLNRHHQRLGAPPSQPAIDVADIGKAIKAERKRRRLTQVQLARLAEVNTGAVVRLEHGENAMMVTVAKIAEALGARIVWRVDHGEA